MQKHQDDWLTARQQIEKCLGEYKSPGSLAKEAGINYFAARRFINFGIHNRSKNAEILRIFFGVELHKTAKIQNPRMRTLTERLCNVWDGTEAHAQLIEKLIESTKPFRIEDRVKGKD
jgi:hypothetical protein